MKYLMKFESWGLKGKDPFVFVRFGGLDLKNQKGYGNKELTFHSPPAKRGIYAMPKIAQELFLVSSLDKTQKGIFKKDISVDGSDFRNKLKQIRKEFRKDSGNIWHHLEEYTDNSDIIDRHDAWIKTDIKVWAKAFSKMSTILRYGRSKYDLENNINVHGEGKGLTGWYSKDHCEVFFDEKV